MLVAIGAPELIVRHEDFRRNLLVELRARNFGAVIVLELIIESLLPCRGALQESLILLEIEASVGLQFGGLHELRWRTELRRLDDFLICDAYPATLVFLIKQHALNEVVEHLIPDLFFLIK